MKKIYFLLAFCALLIGCKVNEPIDIDRDIFNASMESFGNDTRTSLTAGLDVAWSEGDQLTIFRGNHLGDKYQIISQYAGKPYGDFELVEENSIGDNFSSGTELPANVAIYPYSENLTIAKNAEGDNYSYTISGVEFPAQQNYVQNSFAEESFIMTAVTENLSDHKLKFKNVGGAIKLQLKGTGTIKAISIKGNNNENLAGTANVTMSATTTPTFEFSSSTKEVTLDCGANGVELNSAEMTDFIISLPVVEFAKGFTVTVTDMGGKTETLSTSKANSVVRSGILKMPEKALSFTSDPDSPEGPLPMYYGYIPGELRSKYGLTSAVGYSGITEECILDAINLGTVTKIDEAKTMGKTSFGVVPKKSLLLIAVPSGEYVVTMDDGDGAKVKFDSTTPNSNGEYTVTIDGIAYSLYGQYAPIDYPDESKFFYIDQTEEPKPMYYGYIPFVKGVSPTGYDKITGDYILQCVEDGTIKKIDEATTMGKTSFGVVPKYSMLLIAVPSDSGLVVTQDDGDGAKVTFNTINGVAPSNGEYSDTIDGVSYNFYGQYTTFDFGAETAFFYID